MTALTTNTSPEPASEAAPVQAGATGKDMVFSFGDPESVIDGRDLWGYYEIYRNADWYEPPISMVHLAQSLVASPHHRSAVALKVNLLCKHFIPSSRFSRREFRKWAQSYIHMGNSYLERTTNMRGRILSLRYSPAAYTRVGVKPGTYFFINNGGTVAEYEFPEGSMFHLLQPDELQEVYGVPEWIAARQSLLLNENATLFRRRYYINGAHAGSVFHLTDSLMDPETETAMRKAFKDSKGVGNFKNLFLYTPGGKPDGFKVIPISDVRAQDEFSNIKNVTRDDVISVHRIPPQLIGVVPQNNAGFGDIATAMDTFFANEIEPIMTQMLELNDWAGEPLIDFRDYISARITQPS